MKARQEQIENTLTEMVDVIEKHFLAAPFSFIEGKDNDFEYYCFPPDAKSEFGWFSSWNEKWLGGLFPTANEAQRRLKETKNKSDEVGDLAYSAQRFGFVLGVLVACKSMGATREQLMEKSQGFVIPALGQYRSRVEQDAEKAERRTPLR
jgi:hypothetical protein